MEPTTPTIPPHSADITVEWMQSVLEHAGHDATLTGLTLSPIGTGQMASSFRAELSYTSDIAAPRSVVVKVPSDDAGSRQAGAQGAYLREVRFYQHLAARLDVCTPAALFADILDDGIGFVLVLEDLQPARQGDQIQGCTVEQALVASRNIAGLHGPTWCDASLRQIDWLGPPPEHADQARSLLRDALTVMTEGFIQRYQGLLDPAHPELLRWFAGRSVFWLELGDDRFALGHGDHRLDNLMFATADGGHPVSVVDWQTVGVRNPLADVAYLLGTGLDPAARRAHETDIVEAYRLRVNSYGVEGLTPGVCFDDYRAQSFHSLVIIVLGAMMAGQTERGDRMFMTMLQRSAAQIADLDARSLLQ